MRCTEVNQKKMYLLFGRQNQKKQFFFIYIFFRQHKSEKKTLSPAAEEKTMPAKGKKKLKPILLINYVH
jgi:hypothetical protein